MTLMIDPSSDSLFRIMDFYAREWTVIFLGMGANRLQRNEIMNGINQSQIYKSS